MAWGRRLSPGVQSDEAKDLGRRHTPGVMQLGPKGYSWERQGSETDDKEEMYLEADWPQVKGCQLLPKALRGIQDQSLPNGPQEDTVQLTLWFQLKRICIFIFVYLGTKENIYIVQVTQFVVICHCHRKLIRTTLALTFLVTFLTYSYLKRSSSILITKPCDPTTLTRSKQITPQLMSA